ncbi:hypothetical protein M405DRAFT_834869, partial [Rhizopogon salebrosus TDB-379]
MLAATFCTLKQPTPPPSTCMRQAKQFLSVFHATGSCYLLFLGCGTLLNILPQATIALSQSSIAATLQ